MEAKCYSLCNKSLTYYNAQIYGTVHFSVLYEKGVLPAVPHIQNYSLYKVHEYNSFMKQAYFVFIIKQNINVSGNSRVRKMQSSFAGRLRRCSHRCLIS